MFHAKLSIKSKCDCSHTYQDQKHGLGIRVKNPCKKGSNETGYRCPVCGKVE